MRLTKRHREILAMIVDGWKPFPFQLSGLETSLMNGGLVEFAEDDRGNTILVATDAGRTFAERETK